MRWCKRIPFGPVAISSLTLFTRRCATTIGCLLASAPSVILFSSPALFGRRRKVFLNPESSLFFLAFDVGDDSALGGVVLKTSSLWSSWGFGLLVPSACSGSLISGVHKSDDGGVTCGNNGGAVFSSGIDDVVSSGIDGVLEWLEIEFDWLRLYGDVDPFLFWYCMTTGGRVGMGGGGVFLAGFFLLPTPSTEGCFAPNCLGRVFDRGLITVPSDVADDLERSAVLSSTLMLR